MKIVVIEPLGVKQEVLNTLASELLPQGAEVVYYDNRAGGTQELIERGKDADVIIVANQPLPAEAIRGFEKLKLLSVAFTGYDHVAMDACREKGVVVCNCAGYSTAAVADLTFGLILSLYRNIGECDRRIRQGGTKAGLIGPELEGKKFGVIGAGAIGQRVIRIAQALLEECDIVSLHVPLSDSTRGLIGQEQLHKMKNTAILINTARGPVVDSTALVAALEQGEIAGCGVDVFETEPPIADHVLYHAPHALLTPHVAFATVEALVKRARIAYENVKKWGDGQPQNRVD